MNSIFSRATSLLAAGVALVMALAFAGASHAQTYSVVTTCGSGVTYTAGQFNYGTINVAGQLCTPSSGGGSTNSTIVAPLGSQPISASVAVTDQSLNTGGAALNALTAGVNTNGAAVVANVIQVAGSDGTDARSIATNTSGQSIVVGAGTAGSGSGGVVSVQGVSGGTPVPGTMTVTASGGATPFHLASSAASNNATLVSTGAHTLYTLVIAGTNTAIGSVRIYDSVGSPTCSSATGVVLSFPVITTSGLEGGLIVPIPAQGMVLANGLAYCITGAVADNDNTNAPTGISLNGLYK